MNSRKIELKENRLNRAKAQAESYRKALTEKGFDEPRIERDPIMRHLLADIRRINRGITALKWEPTKTAPEEKTEKPKKEASEPKAPKAPKEKKPPKEQQAPQV